MTNLLDLPGFQSVIVWQDGKNIFEYGDISYNKGYLASCRKSILAILYGLYPIDLDKTLGELGIDDKLGLSELEKSATIRDLLKARSGIYHPASNGGDDKNKPDRHSKKPGEHFVYNNWDFNVLGTIFEKETGIDIMEALDELGKQIGFEDFDLEFNKKEFAERKNTQTESIHPPYHMFLSSRDMLKIGLLMLNKGKANGKQIVPVQWIKEITTLHTTKDERIGENLTCGYGYMWWVFDVDKSNPMYGAYMAQGDKGQTITVIPKLNTIIVCKNYLEKKKLLEKILGMELKLL